MLTREVVEHLNMIFSESDRHVARVLGMPDAPYSGHVGLIMAILNALSERGWSPILNYENGSLRWHCVLWYRERDIRVRGEHALPHGAVVYPLLMILDQIQSLRVDLLMSFGRAFRRRQPPIDAIGDNMEKYS